MAKQLIFGSVPHGLQPGRSGYCLVAGHTDLPQSLIRQLEQETSVFPEEGEQLHPRHEIRQTGDIEWHLFTQQTTGIKDYTGRLSGITHIIAERAEALPDNIDPNTLLQHFTNWVTTLPDLPKTFGQAEEINLADLSGQGNGGRSVTPSRPERTDHSDKTAKFSLNTGPQPERPAPRRRRGIYYYGKRRRKSNAWWMLLSVLLVVVILILVF